MTVDGPVAPGTVVDPEDIAEHCWRLDTQPRPGWEREIVHGEHRTGRNRGRPGNTSLRPT